MRAAELNTLINKIRSNLEDFEYKDNSRLATEDDRCFHNKAVYPTIPTMTSSDDDSNGSDSSNDSDSSSVSDSSENQSSNNDESARMDVEKSHKTPSEDKDKKCVTNQGRDSDSSSKHTHITISSGSDTATQPKAVAKALYFFSNSTNEGSIESLI